MKKSRFLSIVLCLVIVLTACSSKDPKKDVGDPAVAGVKVNPPGKFPIVDEKITLKVLMKGNSLVQDWKTNEFTKYLEDTTNIHIDWMITDEKDYQQQLNLVLTSGDLPDVIMNMAIPPEQQILYGDQGTFVSFTDLIEKFGTRTKQIFKEMPELKDAMTAPGGKIYSLPNVDDCLHCSMNGKMYVYKPWLEKLGLKEPTTTEEFREMLRAFKKSDPNGNGQADEIGLVGSPTATRAQLDIFLMNSFIYNDGLKRMILKDGKIDVVYNKPEWKEGLKYLNSLYSEGLLAEQSFTQDGESLKKIAENPGIAVAGAIPAHSPSTFTIVEGPSKRWVEYQPIAPLKGPNGKQVAAWYPYQKASQGGFIMTSANKYPEATMRWADFMLEFENILRSQFGTEGKSWSKAQPGDVGRDGTPALYRLLVPFGRVQNEGWPRKGLGYYSDKEYYAGQAILKLPDKEKMYYDVTKAKYAPYIPPIQTLIPPLFFASKDTQQLAELDKTINDYVNEMIARFTLGKVNIDKEWENYLKTLEQMKLSTYIEIYQKAYDAKMKR